MIILNHITRKLSQKHKEVSHILSSQERAGDGIILCAGGETLLVQAHFLLLSLETLGNDLPIEFFHYGDEVKQADKDLILSMYPTLSIQFVDLELKSFCVNKDVRGFQIKAYALLYTRFERVVYLDVDIIPLHLPLTYLNSSDFVTSGAVFFPDYWIYHSSNKQKTTMYMDSMQLIFKNLTNHTISNDTCEIESGFFVLHTVQHRNALSYFIALNDLHVFFFNFFYGDKELLRLAFMLANESFVVKPFYPNCIGSIIDNQFHGFGMVHMLSDTIISHIHMIILHIFDINVPVNIVRKVHKHEKYINIKASEKASERNLVSITFNNTNETEFFPIPTILEKIFTQFHRRHQYQKIQ